MALHSLQHVTLNGVSACVPADIFYVSEYSHFSEQEKKDFTKHVGIKAKRHSRNKFTTSDLCLKAAERLIAELNWAKEEIGLLILVTQTPDYLLPSTSIILQDKLNLSKDTVAFDVNLGCSGWVYGISITASLMQALKIPKAILLAGETSALADPDDKTTFPLMGDAGTATALALSYSNTSNMHFCLQSDGSGYDSIIARESGSRYMLSKKPNDRLVKYSAQLNGRKILEFCLNHVAPSLLSLKSFAGIDLNLIDYFVFHQANRIINESVRKKLNIPTEKLPYSMEQFGNTSSASIPLTMVTQLKDQLRKEQLLLMCSGFGVGLSLGNVLLRTDKISCPDLIEI